MIENTYSPWTEEQVRILNKFQSSDVFHSFTCPNDGNDLIATKEGWICPCCDYTQNWALASMLEEDLIDNYISWLKFR